MSSATTIALRLYADWHDFLMRSKMAERREAAIRIGSLQRGTFDGPFDFVSSW